VDYLDHGMTGSTQLVTFLFSKHLISCDNVFLKDFINTYSQPAICSALMRSLIKIGELDVVLINLEKGWLMTTFIIADNSKQMVITYLNLKT
jgi:hypothetical protein